MTNNSLILSTAYLILWLLNLPPQSGLLEQDQRQGTLEVSINNVRSGNGTLIICLTATAEDFLEACLAVKTMDVTEKGDLQVYFEDLPFGQYAISLFHDTNANGFLDKRLFGIPKEDFGFSNNPNLGFGSPDFKDCAFAHDHQETSIAINLKSIL
ncbi:MAG: DUF2141 domain-containing protein [Saprospiraceae bacterium]|nr:DUF2141 domain-containing protein [Saprospiraceae bacterium]